MELSKGANFLKDQELLIKYIEEAIQMYTRPITNVHTGYRGFLDFQRVLLEQSNLPKKKIDSRMKALEEYWENKLDELEAESFLYNISNDDIFINGKLLKRTDNA